MMIAIRNATGIDLHLATSVEDGAIRFRLLLDPKDAEDHEHLEKLRDGESFGMVNCPEKIRVKIDAAPTGMAIRPRRRRELVDHIDEDGEIDGEETYLEFTLRLMN